MNDNFKINDNFKRKENLLTITELAKLRKMTSETLRHYDRIGLIKPDFIDPHSGYRYYSIRQYEKLGTVKELRQLGMSLNQIQDYFHERNLSKSIDLLSQYQITLEEEIKKQTALNTILKRKLKFLGTLTNLPKLNTIFEVTYPSRKMITFGEPAGGPREHAFAFTKLECHLNQVAPILASDRVGVYANEQLLEISSVPIPAVPMLLVEEKNIKSEYMKKIPGGTYLCMHYQNGKLEQYHHSFEILKSYIDKHHLHIHGDILQIYKIDVTITSNPEETIMEIQVPVL